MFTEQKNKIMTKKTTTAGETAKLFSMFALAFGLMFIGCKKEGPQGPVGPAGPTGATGQAGPQAKTFVFSLTFNSGDTFKSYSGITGFNTDDVVIVYIHNNTYGGTDYYTQLPYMTDAGSGGVNVWPEMNETNGSLFINTTWADGTSGSPWSSSVTYKFKAVLISSSQFIKYPNLNWANYNEVKSTLKLVD